MSHKKPNINSMQGMEMPSSPQFRKAVEQILKTPAEELDLSKIQTDDFSEVQIQFLVDMIGARVKRMKQKNTKITSVTNVLSEELQLADLTEGQKTMFKAIKNAGPGGIIIGEVGCDHNDMLKLAGTGKIGFTPPDTLTYLK